MAADVDMDSLNDRDSTELLRQAGEKATALLNQLMTDRSQIEQDPPKVSRAAMDECRAAMANTITALRQTFDALGDAVSKPIQSRNE